MALVAGGLVVFSVINLYERQDLPALLSCNNWAQYSPGEQEQQEQDDEEGGEVDAGKVVVSEDADVEVKGSRVRGFSVVGKRETDFNEIGA